MADAPQKRKYYMPLESNPIVFNRLIRRLGVPSLSFFDVFSVDDPDLLAFVPRPALALILVAPTSKAYEEQVKKEESKRVPYEGFGDGEDVVWFKQTIGNACGLYAILHAVSNGEARQYIRMCIPSLVNEL
jgi:ubiquitin carboxyl-terminal hydrolase L3